MTKARRKSNEEIEARLESLETFSDSKQLASGTYTPIITNLSNASSPAPNGVWIYNRVGNVVIVSGEFSANASSGNVDTSVSITLPISGTVTLVKGLISMRNSGTERNSGVVDAASGIARASYNPATVNARAWLVTFQYVLD